MSQVSIPVPLGERRKNRWNAWAERIHDRLE
jgi:hypothetical protein